MSSEGCSAEEEEPDLRAGAAEASVRVVLYGPVCTGKTTLLAALARQRGARVEDLAVPPLFGDPPRHHRGLLLTLECGSDRAELVTQGGPTWGDGQWRHLFVGADAVMLVLDAQAEREAANRRALSELRSLTSVEAGCVVMAKTDLVSGIGLGCEKPCPNLPGVPALWPVFLSRRDRPRSMLEPFDWLMGSRASPNPVG